MNGKMHKFAELYATGISGTQAAIGAGYSERSAYSQATRLLKNAEVQNLIQQIQAAAVRDSVATLTEIKQLYSDVLRSRYPVAAKLRAGQLLTALLPETEEESPAGAAGDSSGEPEEEQENRTIVLIPYNCREGLGRINAVEIGGEVVPLAGHQNDDVLIYTGVQIPVMKDFEVEGEEDE